MKKGLLIIVGVFTFIFFLGSFVNANYCAGSITCSTLNGNTCRQINGCYWYSYGPNTCSTSDDCIYSCSNGKCVCYADSMCNSGEFCNTTSYTCESGYCSGSAGLCSTFDHTSEYTCTTDHSSCTWETGCLLDSDCGTRQTCEGEGGTCSGNYIDTSAPIFPLDSYASYYYGGGTANKLLWNFNETCNWKVETYYYDCMLLNGEWSCQDCGGCGSQLNSEGLYVTSSGSWYKAYCNGNYNWLGFCQSSSWVAGTAYSDFISSAYDTKSCSGFSKSSCKPSGCTWNPTYGTCTNIPSTCGNALIEPGEQCDDTPSGNTPASGDGCSSTCQIESGFVCNGASPTCCYNSVFNWLKNEVPFNSGGDIKEGDILSMVYNDDFCYGTGSTYGYLYKGATLLVPNIYTRIVEGRPGFTRANFTVNSSFINTLGLGVPSNIFFKANFIPINSPSIPVTPRACGDGTCTSSIGENCLNCAADCGCASPQTCVLGGCVAPTVSCGDGKKEGTEECDDGAKIPGDGCSATCTIEAGWACTPGNPSVCYRTDVETYWAIDGQEKSGPDSQTYKSAKVVEGSSIVMVVNDAYGLGCCGLTSSITFNIYREGDSTPLNVNPISGYTDSFSTNGRILSGWYFITSDNLNKIGSGKNIYFEMTIAGTPNKVIRGDTITLAPYTCVLNSASWSTTTATAGDTVQINVGGTGCDGERIIFGIYEKDTYLPLLNQDDYASSASQILYGSPNTYTTWKTVYTDDTDGLESNPPEYYVNAVAVTSTSQVISGVSSSHTGVNDPLLLTVNPTLICGDGIKYGSEACDDGNVNNGDGCSSTCAIESGYSCTGSPSVCSLICGNGIINTGEACDGSNLNGKTCASLLGQGYTGTPSCYAAGTPNQCQFNTSLCVEPPYCTIKSATWSTRQVEEGKPVNLNIQTENCENGRQISFIIKENNVGFLSVDRNVQNNPSNAIVNSNVANGTWLSTEWMNDQGGFLSSETEPPEYYFTATVEASSPVRSLQSSPPDLNVTQKIDAICSDIGYCINYKTRASCNADTCEVGIDTAPGNVQCGGSFNSETGCYDTTDCGCSWNDVSGECGPSVNQVTSCGVCGNSVKDYGEQCDDGNKVSGDGCSSTCTFEDNMNKPCPLGLTLCNDNTCSLNCYSTDTGVSACNYDDVCQSNEGCTCKDCQSEQDTCAINLICNIYNTGCCNSLSDGVCDPYCSYVDPDCSVGKRCGNGYRETGEQCDLGILNGNENSGCSDVCTLMAITDTTNGCPEGTALCTDGTCSLNCYYTDEGIKENFGTCNNVVGVCSEELTCEVIDQACCNIVPDDYCNPYCAYSDPDCVSQPLDKFAIGTCSYNETSTDTCADDNMLVRVLTAAWSWAPGNTFVANPDSASDDYWQPTGSGVFRYDPFDYSKESRKSQKCDNVEDTLVCPASVEVPFFGIYSFIGAIIVVIIVYILFSLKKGKKNSNKKRK